MSLSEPCTLAARQIRRQFTRRWHYLLRTTELRGIATTGAKHDLVQQNLATIWTQADTLKLLRRVDQLLSNPNLKNAPNLPFWKDLIERARDRLSSPALERKPHIVVYGDNANSASPDLVTLLLDNPFATDKEQYTQIRDRWKDGEQKPLRFEYGPQYSRNGDTIHVVSPWLERLSTTITELPPGSSQLYPDAFNADIPIIIVNPFVTSISDIRAMLPLNPHAILVVNASASKGVTKYTESEVAKHFEGHRVRVLFVDVEKALHAVSVLRAEPTSPAAIGQYQKEYEASHASSLLGTLQGVLEEGSAVIRTRSVHSVGIQAVAESRQTVASMANEVSTVQKITQQMREYIYNVEIQAMKDVLGANSEMVHADVTEAEKHIKKALNEMKWWRLPMQVDDLSQIVDLMVNRSLTQQLQKQLIFQAGRLAQMQATYLVYTNSCVASLPPSLTSPVLQNTLAQLSLSPSYKFTADSLSTPLSARLGKLAFPTNRLHLKAQQAILSTSFCGFASAATGYAAWTGGYVHGATALGASALLTASVLRWSVGAWERAKARWLQDWARVCEGLGRDLKLHLGVVMKQQVLSVPERAREDIEILLDLRKREIESLQGEIEAIEAELELPQK